MNRTHSETFSHQKLSIISRTLNSYFNMEQGVIMGNTAVISRKVHEEPPGKPGEIGIFRDRDAGRHYLRLEETGKIVHIDVLHRPAEINQIDVANRIRQAIPAYLGIIDRNQDWSREEQELAAANLTRRIHLYTGLGYGTALDPTQKAVKGTDDRYVNHVHILARLLPRYYSLAYCIIDEVERAILYQGAELRPVIKIVHYGDIPGQSGTAQSSLYIPPLADNLPSHLRRQNLLQVISSLAMKMGSIEAVADFFQALSPLRSVKMGNLHRIHENLDQILHDMAAAGLVKRNLFGYTLTDTGHDLEEFLLRNKKELSAEIRKSVRQFKATPARYQTFRYSHLKSKEKQFPNRRKVMTPANPESWRGEIAVPETVTAAAKRTYITGNRPLRIRPEDIRVFARNSYAPVDTCLLIDCSGSMMGERIKAVGFVAEYLLLTSREKLALVTFQETSAKVAIPFTRSYDTIHQGLTHIKPGGMTPLAHGIMETLEMFKTARPRNPLLVLVTDGLPNYPLWTTNPVEDALKAAREIAKQKIRFVCIGIDPDQRFLPLLAEAGKGNIYIVDESDRNNMIEIISRERKQYQYGG